MVNKILIFLPSGKSLENYEFVRVYLLLLSLMIDAFHAWFFEKSPGINHASANNQPNCSVLNEGGNGCFEAKGPVSQVLLPRCILLCGVEFCENNLQ